MNIKIIEGDITLRDTDAIVNAANSSLLGGGGVDGAIHRRAGKELLKECMTLNGCKTGDAKITKGYNLKADFVIHTVGPIYREENRKECEALLFSCYRKSLQIAKEKNLKSISFPLISAGVYGYPKKEALRIAVEAIQQEGLLGDDYINEIVLFDREAIEIAKKDFAQYMA